MRKRRKDGKGEDRGIWAERKTGVYVQKKKLCWRLQRTIEGSSTG
jgi:hypothetical protein